MTQALFDVKAPGVDTEALVEKIRKAVRDKQDRGVYADARVARAERSNLAALKNDEQFVGFYLQCLRDAVFVDISDFDIREKRSRLAPLLICLKKIIWKLLKFYTYRLWSQQNQVNGLLVTAVEGVDEKYAARTDKLEARIRELEERRPA